MQSCPQEACCRGMEAIHECDRVFFFWMSDLLTVRLMHDELPDLQVSTFERLG